MNKLTNILSLIVAVFGLHHTLTAHPVDLQTAQSVAVKFTGASDAQLVSTYRTDKSAAAFYVFNTEDGFVIVSADDCETPIIGYSHEGRFDPNDVPEQMEAYLQDFVARMQYGIENHIVADETTARQWELVKTTGRLNNHKVTKAVEPLLTEMWHQGCLYNNLCPSMEHTPCGHAEVGCVAVAMGQIMHYWRYPETGWGSHSYSNSGLTLSADFGNTVYDWDHMPDSLTDNSNNAEIEAVATLLFHCGVSVNMKYTSNGSGADSGDVPDALIRYFNYSRHLHIEKRSDFDDEEWKSMLKACLDLHQPVYYEGKGGQGSHAFVCDGYDSNDLLHFNWGWGRANGYFALGNLNPIGFSFNEKNYAIFDINPQYEPWTVSATVYPPTAGTIVGTGEYHIGEQCTLTAIPNGNSSFSYWKKSGNIISYDRSYSFMVNADVDDIEAHFSLNPIKEIQAFHAPDTNDMNSPFVNLTWNYDSIHEWNLLRQLEIDGEITGLTTDGEYIYTNNNRYDDLGKPIVGLKKYTMDGDLVDLFELESTYVLNTTNDGSFIYFGNNSIYSLYLYLTDFTHKTIVDSINMNFRPDYCAYDVANDSFWLHEYQTKKIALVNRQGETICIGPTLSTYSYINGFGSITAEDGSLHLLIIDNVSVKNYDTFDRSFNNHYIAPLSFIGSEKNACIGKYDGKDALFVSSYDYFSGNSRIYIFEIDCHLARIKYYRLYRSDSEGNSVMLADEVTNTSYIDRTWNEANAGAYRFGISEVYFNGAESEIIWSDTIVKTDHGLKENNGETNFPEQSVQKVIEDGQIVIIKDGKRYNVSGQHLN